MLTEKKEFQQVFTTIVSLLRAGNNYSIEDTVANSDASIELTDQDNWNGGTFYYTIYLSVAVEEFSFVAGMLELAENEVLEKARLATRNRPKEVITAVIFVPKESSRIDWTPLAGWLTKEDLLKEILCYSLFSIPVAVRV